MDRRTFLARAATSAGATTALAGCTGGGPGASDEARSSPPGSTSERASSSPSEAVEEATVTDARTVTDSPTPTFGAGPQFGDHAATTDVGSQPFEGPPPGEATGTIVAFEDPSCPVCKRFRNTTLPAITSNLVDTGTATYVFRGYPVVAPWGRTAAAALEAAFVRDPATHWGLLDHYYTVQDELYGDVVLERTRGYLEERTDVDVDEFVADVEDGTHDPAVESDLAAGMAGGAGDVTPTLVLFRDGAYRTKARGNVSYSVVEAALGL
jgi:protein-disulfide isomerase